MDKKGRIDQKNLWMTLESPPTLWQNNVTLGTSLSLVKGLYLISMTHYDMLS